MGTTTPLATVLEFTDPVCSWAWGAEPKLRLLRWRYEDRLGWRTIMGGLVGDQTNRRADWDPIMAAKPMAKYWKAVTDVTGAPYPTALQYMPRSSDHMGIVAKAAERQGVDIGRAVLRRLRDAIFVYGVPADAPDQTRRALHGVEGLDLDRLIADLSDDATIADYTHDYEATRRPNDFVRTLEGDWMGIGNVKQTEGRDRYAFPTLLVRHGDGSDPAGETTAPGWVDYEDYLAALEQISPGITADPRPDPTPAEAFARWPMLTAVELTALCGADATPPEGVTSYDWGEGVVWRTEAEAVSAPAGAISAGTAV